MAITINYGVQGRIGMLLPSGNAAAEPQIQAMLPAGVSLHTTRLKLVGSSEEQLLGMATRVEEGAQLLADAGVDIITFNCTAVSTWDPRMETSIVRRISDATGIRATATSEALVEALGAFGARKVALITPYIAPVNDREVAFLERHGFTVLSCTGRNLETPAEMLAVEPEQWFAMALGCRHPDADAYLISCTAIRSAEVIAPLELALDRPVITSNQAAIWWSLRRLGITGRPDGFGQLLSEH